MSSRQALVVGLLLLGGCGPASYSSREFSGFVKDGATGAPIPGAVVVATWQVSRGTFPHGNVTRILHVSEAVSDQNGKYTLQAWGPKARPLLWKLDVYDTNTLVFKPGYALKHTVGHNIGYSGEIAPALVPETRLGAITQDPGSYALLLSMTTRRMCCENEQLENYANYILLVSEERRRLRKLGVPDIQLRELVDVERLSAEQRRILERRRKPPG